MKAALLAIPLSVAFSPVANAYFDRAPFEFEGTLKKLHFQYLPAGNPNFMTTPDDD